MTGVKIPRWEAELWSYISSGDGVNCPLSNDCQIRQRGGWCVSDHSSDILQLLDASKFDVGRHDFIECATLGRIFQLIEKLAQRYLTLGNVCSPPVPTKLVTLLDEQHPVEIRKVPLSVYHGAIWHLWDEWIIHLNANDPRDRRRLTLFHEAFHIVAHCHSRATPVFRKRGTLQGCFNEMLADYFAIFVLAPRELVKEKWAEVNDLERMAEIFDVPKPAMWLRLRQLGLI